MAEQDWGPTEYVECAVVVDLTLKVLKVLEFSGGFLSFVSL